MQSSKPSGKSTAEPACPLPTNEYSEVSKESYFGLLTQVYLTFN